MEGLVVCLDVARLKVCSRITSPSLDEISVYVCVCVREREGVYAPVALLLGCVKIATHTLVGLLQLKKKWQSSAIIISVTVENHNIHFLTRFSRSSHSCGILY